MRPWGQNVALLIFMPFQPSTMCGTKEARKASMRIISSSAPPVARLGASSALWFRDGLCVSCHQWFVAEAGLGGRSKCVIWGLGLILALHQSACHHHCLIHTSHHSVHANRMRLFLINLLRASLQQIVFFDSTVKIILSTEPQLNMSSSACTLGRKTGNVGKTGRAERYRKGELSEKLLERYTSYTQVFCQPLPPADESSAFSLLCQFSSYFSIPGHSSPVICFGNAIIC